MRSEENVTLVCSSESAFEQFHLLREGQNLGRPLAGGQSPHRALQSEFPLGPGSPAHSGVYRCYSSFSHSPTHAQTPATHCSCLLQVMNLFLARALLPLFRRYVLSNSLPLCGLQHDRLLCPSLPPPHGSQPCSGEGAFIPQ